MSQPAAEELTDFGRGLEAFIGVLGQQLLDDRDEPFGDIGIDRSQWSRQVFADTL